MLIAGSCHETECAGALGICDRVPMRIEYHECSVDDRVRPRECGDRPDALCRLIRSIDMGLDLTQHVLGPLIDHAGNDGPKDVERLNARSVVVGAGLLDLVRPGVCEWRYGLGAGRLGEDLCEDSETHLHGGGAWVRVCVERLEQ